MDVSIALLADAANVSQEGKLNILGAFTQIYALSFPVVHPQMNVVLQFEPTPAEFGQTKHLQLVLLDADGKQIGALDAEIQVSTPADPTSRPKVCAIVALPNAKFDHAGDYAIHVLIGGEDKRQIEFSLLQLSNASPEEEADEPD